MKKSRIIVSLLAVLLVGSIACNLVGCVEKVKRETSAVSTKADIMADVTPRAVTPLEDLQTSNEKAVDFAVRLFQASRKADENTLISPLSVLCALAMTANGAQEETLAQMESVLGMNVQELNSYLYSYMQTLPQGEDYKLKLANSIWFRDDPRFTVEQSFLQTNADYYEADLYKAAFDDQTCKDINNWVKENTDGMISNVLDKIPDNVLMYLINALAFDAKWDEPYMDAQVRQGTFTQEDGTKENAEFMHSSESIFLDDGKATGFMKYYKGGKYAFVAMLPNEGVSLSEYAESLDGEALYSLLGNPEYIEVSVALPKFAMEYQEEMSDILKGMGMPDAFEPEKADLGKLGSSTGGNIYITSVLHKTYISVDENGTKAAAVTVVAPGDEGAAMVMKEVRLDRPFVYMLVDCENNIPFFIGTMMDLEG